MKKKAIILFLMYLLLWSGSAYAQRFLMDMVDTTNQVGKGLLSIYEKYNRVRISGYIQPQFQLTTTEGAETFDGGNFALYSDSRFMLRRGRLRVDYTHLTKNGDPSTYFVFQFDGTERGFFTRDFFGRFYENKFKLLSVTTGLFARPFGYEVNLSSATRESPERGRMSQILMKTERDIGVMLTLNDRRKNSRFGKIKVDIGLFNGQGLSGPTDFDGQKDLIARISLLPTKMKGSKGPTLTAGVSGYLGGMTSQSQVLYRATQVAGKYIMQRDSSLRNQHKLAPRNYAGADMQLIIPNQRGATEFRAEYMFGTQTATLLTSESPGVYPVTNGKNDPLYIRRFDGAYFYFLQHLGSEKHQLVVKYDWYDPNKKVAGTALVPDDGFTKADLRFNSLGAGYVYYANPNLKFILYYNRVKNEKSGLTGFERDANDDVFTGRVQYAF